MDGHNIAIQTVHCTARQNLARTFDIIIAEFVFCDVINNNIMP